MKILKENKKIIVFFGLSLLIMAVMCFLLYHPMINFLSDPTKLRSWLQERGVLGILCLLFMMALQVIFVFLPGEIIEVLAGFIYGSINGMLICLLGAAIGSIIIFYLVRKWKIVFVSHILKKDQLEEVSFLKNQTKLEYILFLIFFIPGTPKDIITYFIPFTNMSVKTFLVITSIARIPSIITSTISGNAFGIKNYQFGMLVFIVTGCVALLGIFIYNHKIKNLNL